MPLNLQQQQQQQHQKSISMTFLKNYVPSAILICESLEKEESPQLLRKSSQIGDKYERGSIVMKVYSLTWLRSCSSTRMFFVQTFFPPSPYYQRMKLPFKWRVSRVFFSPPSPPLFVFN